MAALEIDTRQKEGCHLLKHGFFKASGIRCIRTKLYVGDYRFVGGRVTVDTKQDFQELHGDLTLQHDRFRDECERARDAGYALIILVENEHGITSLAELMEWMEPASEFKRRKHAKRRISGKTLAKQCSTMHERYGVFFDFCHPNEAGRRVIELLDREEWFIERMKEVGE